MNPRRPPPPAGEPQRRRNWQHRFFYRLIRLGGRRAAYGFLRLVVLYYTLLRPDQRRKGLHYLRRRFPGAGRPELLRHSCRHSLSLGQASTTGRWSASSAPGSWR